MKIEEAQPNDIPGIISVLQVSIGDSKLPKSQEIWNYKHLINPFGASLVMVAKNESGIIGVRALMSWEWRLKGDTIKAFRAVDTGVHPAYQRKGVFKKLNIAALKLAKEKGNKIIFNTPNSKSLAGNLKLGWKKVDNLKVKVIPVNPVYKVTRNTNNNDKLILPFNTSEINNLLEEYNSLNDKTNKVYTPKSVTYLKWRYEINPLQEYTVMADEDFYLAAYIKNHKYFKELRVVEHIYTSPKGQKKIKELIFELSKKKRAHIITVATQFDVFKLSFSGKFGPILTVRNLNLQSRDYESLINLEHWRYTLGDLELF